MMDNVTIRKEDLTLFEEDVKKGGCGYVVRAIHRDGRELAIKFIRSDKENVYQNKKLRREAMKMKELSHQSIVKVYGLVMDDMDEFAGIAMEYVQGGCIPEAKMRIATAVKKNLPIQLLNRWAYEIADGISYIHDQNIVHKDIKATNCLIDKELHAKICDFELCRGINFATLTMEIIDRPTATISHQAPEVITNIDKLKDYDPKYDIYSLGITLFEVYSDDSQPYPREYWEQEALLMRNIEEGLRPNVKELTNTPQKVIQLMEECWVKDSTKRPTAKYVMEKLGEVYIPKEAEDEAAKLKQFVLQKKSSKGTTYPEAVKGFLHDGTMAFLRGPTADHSGYSNGGNRVWMHLTDEQAESRLDLQKNNIDLGEKENEEVSTVCLQSVANQIGPIDFKYIGRCLLFEEYELDTFHHDFQGLGIAEVNTKMLSRWKEVNDKNATYEWLATACLSIKRMDIIETLKIA